MTCDSSLVSLACVPADEPFCPVGITRGYLTTSAVALFVWQHVVLPSGIYVATVPCSFYRCGPARLTLMPLPVLCAVASSNKYDDKTMIIVFVPDHVTIRSGVVVRMFQDVCTRAVNGSCLTMPREHISAYPTGAHTIASVDNIF